ncbi:MAG: EI24 domain-containing protein [Cyanobacteria bacterium J06642_2]
MTAPQTKFPVPILSSYQPHRGPFYQFWAGVRFCLAGFGMLRRSPRLQLTSVVPVVMTAVGFVALFVYGLKFARHLVAQMLTMVPDWALAVAETVSSSLVVITMLLITYLLFFPLLGAIAIPFREELAAHTSKLANGRTIEGPDWNIFQTIWIVVTEIIKVIAFQICILILLLCFNIFLPVAGSAIAIGITCFLTGLDMVDPALGQRGFLMGKKLAFLSRHGPLMAGFGATAFILLAIPGVNLFALPVATIGGSLLVFATLQFAANE